jgi:hypothetical protein
VRFVNVVGAPCPLLLGPLPQLAGTGRLPKGVALKQSSFKTCEFKMFIVTKKLINNKNRLINYKY